MNLSSVCSSLSATAVTATGAILLGGAPALLAALYVSESAPRGSVQRIKQLWDVCASVPAVVWGHLVLVWVVPALASSRDGAVGLLPATLALAAMTAPTVALLSLNALRDAPDALREASLALGASRWHTAWFAVLPSARRGVLFALGFALVRAAGEALAVDMLLGRDVATAASRLAAALSATSDLASPRGLRGALTDTVTLSLAAVTLAAPLGVASGAWLALAPRRSLAARVFRHLGGGLIAAPSVVIGALGYAALGVALGLGPTLLVAAVTLAAVIVSDITSATERALRSLPVELEEASLALGASRSQTLVRVQLPAASRALLAGLVRALGRCLAEGGALAWMTGIPPGGALSPLRGGAPLTVYLWHADVRDGAHASAWAAALILVLLTAATTLAAQRIGRAT